MSFSCYVIGGNTLLMTCCDLMLQQGHTIKGVISADERVHQWAKQKELPWFLPKSDYMETMKQEPFDYLFSIAYLAVVPEPVLILPSKAAINFHDGPLPHYAGLNTPAWALMQGESTYGITWHHMTAKVDQGQVLKQKAFEISAGETSLSLNTKCFETAIETFGELVTELNDGRAVTSPQPPGTLKYYKRFDRPEAACFLDFSRPAKLLNNLIRGLDFGPYENPLGSPKIRIGEHYAIVREAEVREGFGAPGTVMSQGSDALVIGTGDGLLAITKITDILGRNLSLDDFAKQCSLAVGDHCFTLTGPEAERFTTLNSYLARSEDVWTRRLTMVTPLDLPFSGGGTPETTSYHRLPIPIPEGLLSNNQGKVEAVLGAFQAFMGRALGKASFYLGFSDDALKEMARDTWVTSRVPLRVSFDAKSSFQSFTEKVVKELGRLRKHKSHLIDLIARRPQLTANEAFGAATFYDVTVTLSSEDADAGGAPLGLVINSETGAAQVLCRKDRYGADAAATLARYIGNFFGQLVDAPSGNMGQLSLMDEAERDKVLTDWNATATDFDRDTRIHEQFEAQVARNPVAPAVAHLDNTLTYAQLNQQANQLARHLRELGIGQDDLVGIHLSRSTDLVMATLAAQKAGGAYLPLDPAYPVDRTAYMVEDSGVKVVITQSDVMADLPHGKAKTVVLDREKDNLAQLNGENLGVAGDPTNLAYMIYTSGSTGKPKGVMVPHRTVINFFKGMDEHIPHQDGGTWLAVTSLSFDISVLELSWTLTHGFKVVVFDDPSAASDASKKGMKFSLFYFSNSESAEKTNKYRLLLDGAKWADEHDFVAVWTPERHFFDFGGLYAHPAVTGAAVAAVTKNVQIRAGSLVVPLHHPARIAETWAMVDNLSNGRVGIAAASGWAPTDFLLMPNNFKNAKQVMFDNIKVIQKLWAGETVEFPGATGESVAISTLPRPVQKTLPIWITTAGNIETYRMAGEIGANVLTHLLGQSTEELAPKIAAYRKALKDNGFDPNSGEVTLMLHSFVGEDEEMVRNAVREPLKNYLGSSLNLLKKYAWAFPAFSRPDSMSNDAGNDFDSLSDEERDAILEGAFDRYYETSGLFGHPNNCVRMVDSLKAIGVDEVAALIDFGLPTDLVLEHLPQLDIVHRRCNENVRASRVEIDPEKYGLAPLVEAHGVTHMQCTPSMAQMMTTNAEMQAALGKIKNLFVGGEALPAELASKLTATGASVRNMYGPTETTIWSSTEPVTGGPGAVSIGKPIANTQLYVLDPNLDPMPPGAAGELYIAGDGVTRGYHHRPSLSGTRFVPDPFGGEGGRMYRTGDLVRWNDNGTLAFLGRVDFQVKIRGFRIELGEIETRLSRHPSVEEAVVLAREDNPGDVRLVAYLVAKGEAPSAEDLRDFMREKLPDYMVPGHFAVLDAFPLTPNKKIDRKALPAPDAKKTKSKVAYAAPESETEGKIVSLWQELLGRDQVGIDDNFFDIGGHSLLVVRMHRQLEGLLERSIPLTDMYRFTTIRSLGNYLTTGGDTGEKLKKSTERAQRRLAARRRGR